MGKFKIRDLKPGGSPNPPGPPRIKHFIRKSLYIPIYPGGPWGVGRPPPGKGLQNILYEQNQLLQVKENENKIVTTRSYMSLTQYLKE